MPKTFYQQVTSEFKPSSTIACRSSFRAAASSRKHTAECPLWVISGYQALNRNVRFTPESGHPRRAHESAK